MVKLEWNALRVGDKVVVHDSSDPAMQLVPGTVALVETARRSNEVGIRVVAAGGRSIVLWPSRLAIHADPLDPGEDCWRCDAIVAEARLRHDAARSAAS
jgi:hypothetical protein